MERLMQLEDHNKTQMNTFIQNYVDSDFYKLKKFKKI